MERIIVAFGIDYKDKNSRIDFDLYVRIKCFMKYYTISVAELKKIWLKIINPSAALCLPKDEVMDLFERFSRGRIQSKKILVSAQFSENMIEILTSEGCLNPENDQDIMMEVVADKLDDGTFDIELFNQMIKTECSYCVWSKNREFE